MISDEMYNLLYIILTCIINLIGHRATRSTIYSDKGRLNLSIIRYDKFGFSPLFFVIAISFCVICVTSCYEEKSNLSLDDRAQSLNKVIMCPLCPGESIDQSQNQLAVQMRQIVLGMLREGATDSEVKQYFVERYDISVLLEPPRKGFGLILWVVPPVVAIISLLTLFYTFKVMLRPRGSEKEEGTVSLLELSHQERVKYICEVDALLKIDRDTNGSHGGAGKGLNNG